MRSAVVVASLLAGCDAAVTLTVDGDLPVPIGVDAICVAVADRDPAGGAFGRVYPLTPPRDHLPQTLAVAPGGAATAEAWVRGYRAGFEVARDRGLIDFGGDVALRLDRCRRGRSGAVGLAGTAPGAATRVVGSLGRGGALAVVLGDGARVLDVDGGALIDRGALATGAVVAAVAADLDGDCGDDLVTASAAAPPQWWHRDGLGFAAPVAIGASAARAVVATDADGDGDLDLVLARADGLALARNDGAGRFTADAAAFGGVAVAEVVALAAGDVDGDGRADLIVGQRGAPLVVLVGTGAGYAVAAGAAPAVALDVAGLNLVDADGDGDLDLVVTLASAAPRLYVARDGRLEDQSYVRMPQPATVAAAVAIARVDDDCVPDLAVVGDTGLALARGTDAGAFVDPQPLAVAGARDLAAIDLDDDGVVELIVVGDAGTARVMP